MLRVFLSFIAIFLVLSPVHIISGYSLQDTIELSGKSYTYREIARIIDSYMPQDVLQKDAGYDSLARAIYLRERAETKREKKEYYRKFFEIIQIARASHDYVLNSKVHDILLWYSQWGREIRWYFKWAPRNGYNLITANIHGSYEYGTYETAKMLIEELKKSQETGWFIIPTLNPDGLIEYETNSKTLNAYLQGRDNLRGVDLNRNFCTKNFTDIEFSKYGKMMLTSSNGQCASELETRVMMETLEQFYIKTALSLHSTGWILYIPDWSIDDQSVIQLGKKVLRFLPGYDFYPNTSSEILRQASIKKYEIDEGNSGLFTGTLETYIYETYGIPTLLIELASHGSIEYNLKEIFTLDI